MAWRIAESVSRGEIDNRIPGRVTGRVWFIDRHEPLVLELAGNTWRDLAGHLLRFTNPTPKARERGDLDGLANLQNGVVGDITASRKVRVPECSMEEFLKLYEQRKPFPWHWSNSLYLEWHSETNGRVLIESADYVLDLDPDGKWSMDEAEEAVQREANGAALLAFLKRLNALIEDERWGDDREQLE